MNFIYTNTDSFSRFNAWANQLKTTLNSPETQALKASVNQIVENIPLSIKAVHKLGREQYVCWERFSNEVAEQIMYSYCIDDLLLSHETKGSSPKINNTIEKCAIHCLMDGRKLLFSDIVSAYQNRLYMLTVIGLFSIIDGVLSEMTDEQKITSISQRVKKLLDKEIDFKYKGANIYSLLTTLSITTSSISAQSDFDLFEPTTLNRHWFIHGRSTRVCSQLDCIKLFNYLYGIMLFFDITNQND